MTTKLFELMSVSTAVKSAALQACEFCAIGFEPEDLEEYEGYLLCDECKAKHMDEVEKVHSENQVQAAMDKMPTDELLNLRWMLSIAYQQIENKEGCDNIHKWNNRITSALISKKLDSKNHPLHSGRVPMSGNASSHIHRTHSIHQ